METACTLGPFPSRLSRETWFEVFGQAGVWLKSDAYHLAMAICWSKPDQDGC